MQRAYSQKLCVASKQSAANNERNISMDNLHARVEYISAFLFICRRRRRHRRCHFYATNSSVAPSVLSVVLIVKMLTRIERSIKMYTQWMNVRFETALARMLL